MEYWKARGAKLTLLVNQINTQPARMTLVTLRAAQSKILKVWNNIDKRITKYHVEAADNAKFLGAIEKTSHSIYLEDPSELKGELLFPFLAFILSKFILRLNSALDVLV